MAIRFAVWMADLDRRDALSPRDQLLLFMAGALAVVSRCPSLFYRAQFYAEDGVLWYRQAYTLGWAHALLIPDAGYLQFLQRTGAGVALLAPFRWAPLCMALFGLVLQCLPVVLLLSARCRSWGPLSQRVLFAAIYIALPNAREIHVDLTNSQWHLGLLALLLAFASPPASWRGRLFDVGFFLFAGFCGPFGIPLLPMILVFRVVRRQRWSLAVAASLIPGVLVQLWELTHSNTRTHAVLDASLAPLLRIFGGDIIACAIFGGYPIAHYAPMILIVPAALGGLAVYLYALRFAIWPLRLLIVFSGVLLAAALRSPMIGGPLPLWDELVLDYSGRYWFFPMLAFLWSAVWCAREARHRFFRVGARWVLVAMLIGVLDNWEYRAYRNESFPASAARFAAAAPGTHVLIPITPNDWTLDLVKRTEAKH